ncbi:aminoacetone oxidase family FAD-binding enzyme [Ruminococcus sp.]|uniref:aminoacetone oxidase family FAD-binding enzyme n=1 Tax=Ruminococcus sp. TaxID=41978 RepID=UPI0025CFD8D6|nr:aminoacetone oxidase family FAD-binding enzyme [Ruminococcus sp.]MCI6615756.1 aminoacetone oxidase family FAD-binding enzyme [Ruminococcus sp.]
MHKSNNFDVVIVGGGASGLMCAISAKQRNKNISVAIIEKNDRVGKKLLSTGNGRCNLTHNNITAENYCGSFKKQSNAVFEKYNTKKLLEIFKNLGLLTFCDNEGRYYPQCKQASAVLDVLRFACGRLNVEIFCGENIRSIRQGGKSYSIKTDGNEFVAKKLVIANGSKAAPKLGGNSSSADYLKNLGHSFVPFSPALCPIKVKSDVIKSLKGIRANAKAVLFDNNGKIVKEEIGEVQFNDNSLSGICIFNLSLYTKKDFLISLDLLPDISYRVLKSLIYNNKKLFSDLTIDNLLTGILQKRLGQAVLKESKVTDFSRKCNTLFDSEIENIVKIIKDMRFPVIENCGFEQAQCALGGVNGREIDENTMQSKIIKNLYICGEAIDLCGECGGYNLHFAFASGLTAGESL